MNAPIVDVANREKLKAEAERATQMLKGKVVAQVWRHREDEIGIEFTDGTRLFVDGKPEGLELSITDDQDREAAKEE